MSKSDKPEKIVVIEGDSALGESISLALNQDGYDNVALVKNGNDGLKAIYDTLPHLVIIDVSLPGMNGYEILRKKSGEQLLSKIPVFLLSMQGVPISMREVPEGSVVEYIMALHANPSLIVDKVNRYFNHENQEGAASQGPKIKLLWIEDDRLIGTILAKKFVSSGFDLFHAKRGEEALESLKTSTPDVIVVDLILPGMSGFEILQKMNADPALKQVPRIVLSNLSKPSDIERARALGAQKFLVKAATSLDQIVAEIRGVCKK